MLTERLWKEREGGREGEEGKRKKKISWQTARLYYFNHRFHQNKNCQTKERFHFGNDCQKS